MRRDAIRMRLRAKDAAVDAITVAATTRLDVPQPGSSNFDFRVRETLMTYLGKQGDFMDRGVTVRDLMASGVVTLPDGWKPGAGGGGAGGTPPFIPSIDTKPDLTPPPDVSGFKVTPGISVIFFETDDPVFTQGHGYLRTNVYGKAYNPATDPLPTFADAQLIFSFTGQVGSWATQPSLTLRVWAKWESNDDVESVNPVGGTNGIEVTTGQDVDALVKAMTGPGDPFKEVTDPILLPDGTTVPPGVYISDAYIHAMQVTTAMIHDAAITNAKVSDLSADKITAGTIAVGQYIRSSGYIPGSAGWIINGNASAEFNNITARGTIVASAGAIGGALIGATFVQSTNYSANLAGWRWENDTGNVYINTLKSRGEIMGGSFTGANWPPAGQTGYYLGPTMLMLGNANDGKYFQVSTNGDVSAPQFSITSGAATFSGALSAASGTFSGSLTAGAIDAVDTINIKGNAVTLPASATGSSAEPTGTSIVINALANLPVFLITTIDGGGTPPSNTLRTLTIYIDGVIAKTVTSPGVMVDSGGGGEAGGQATFVNPSMTVSHSHTPTTAGNHTYKVAADGDTTSAFIFVMQTKR